MAENSVSEENSDPAVYPYNLHRIYPTVRREAAYEAAIEVKVNTHTHGLEFVSCIYTCPCQLHLPLTHVLG